MTGDPAGRERLGRLRWRCRRGTRELDELLSGYLRDAYLTAPPAEQVAFEQLLDAPDADINDWCLGRREPPAGALAALIGRITTRAAHGS